MHRMKGMAAHMEGWLPSCYLDQAPSFYQALPYSDQLRGRAPGPQLGKFSRGLLRMGSHHQADPEQQRPNCKQRRPGESGTSISSLCAS